MAKDFVIVKGRVVRMNDAAYRIASKHFGATKNRPEEKHVPIELLKMPKLPIIPAQKSEIINFPRKEIKESVNNPEPAIVEPEPVRTESAKIEIPVVNKEVTVKKATRKKTSKR